MFGVLAFAMAAACRAPASSAGMTFVSLPDTPGIFVQQDDGAVRHVQSHLRCPPGYADYMGVSAFVNSTRFGKGGDVGCVYARHISDFEENSHSLVTLTVTRAVAGTTLAQALAAAQARLREDFDHVEFKGEAPVGAPPAQPILSAQYLEGDGGDPFTLDLYVTRRRGWFIAVRVLYPGRPGMAPVRHDPYAVARAASDRALGLRVLKDAYETIGK